MTQWEAPAELATPAAAASDWTAVKDAEGRTYYHNAKTNATQWEAPPGFGAAAAAAVPAAAAAATVTPSSASAAGAGAGAAATPAAAAAVPKAAVKRAAAAASEPQSIDDKLAARARKFTAARRQEKARAQPSACA